MDISDLQSAEPTKISWESNLRPKASLTLSEKYQEFINRPAFRILAIGIVCSLIVGYFAGSREQKHVESMPIVTAKSYQATESTSKKTPKIKIYITGAVNAPGVIEVDGQARIYDAIEVAGGTTSAADLAGCNLAGFLVDGMSIVIPEKNSANPKGCNSSQEQGDGQTSLGTSQSEKINLNTASQTEIETLPGIGPAMGAAILKYRKDHGSFSSVNDLRKIKGVGDKRFNDLKDLVEVE